MKGRIVAFGEPTAGDDGVGPGVLAHLATLPAAAGIALVHVRDTTRLVALLENRRPTVLVDAVRNPPPGRVLEISRDEVDASTHRFASTHGFGVGDALALALALGIQIDSLAIVGITITDSSPGRPSLSEEVAAAVPEASHRALALLQKLGADNFLVV